MTESSSDADETIEGLKTFTVVMIRLYSDEAKRQLMEAEELVAKGIAMREHAILMLDRATELALSFAKKRAEDLKEAVAKATEGDIPW